jgi:hypothetical protein
LPADRQAVRYRYPCKINNKNVGMLGKDACRQQWAIVEEKIRHISYYIELQYKKIPIYLLRVS